MADVIGAYNKARVNAVSSGMERDLDRLLSPESPWQKSELERLARHLPAAIIHDVDAARKQPAYVLIDLFNIGRLQREGGIFYPSQTLSSLYHLMDDYLKPESEQVYRLGAEGIAIVLEKILILHLEPRTSIGYIERVIRMARKRAHPDIRRLEIVKNLVIRPRNVPVNIAKDSFFDEAA